MLFTPTLVNFQSITITLHVMTVWLLDMTRSAHNARKVFLLPLSSLISIDVMDMQRLRLFGGCLTCIAHAGRSNSFL